MDHGYIDIRDTTNMIKGPVIPNTPEEKQAAMRAVCGARACRGPEDAKIVLEALGLIEGNTNAS